ncbi:vitamin K epoxide reductase family protein [Cesiribacter andamanensis]|nr:vitamin K epoxide reductase family protein [Cesiribacter andamanensis]
MNPVQHIRNASGSAARHRRTIALLSALGVLDFIPISLYQLGVIRHLPDPPSALFDSDAVNASEEARILGLPDGPISLALYAASIGLAGAALARNTSRSRLDVLLGGLLLGQAAGGVFYLYNMATVQKKVCLYCVAGAFINVASLIPLSRLLRQRGT